MKVKELIAELAQCDFDAEVHLAYMAYNGSRLKSIYVAEGTSDIPFVRDGSVVLCDASIVELSRIKIVGRHKAA